MSLRKMLMPDLFRTRCMSADALSEPTRFRRFAAEMVSDPVTAGRPLARTYGA